MKLPEQGLSRPEIARVLESYRAQDLQWKTGRTFGFVYDSGHEATAIGKEAYASFLTENALDPTSFPSLLRLENEVVGMARQQASGDAAVVGTFTSGGTESIMLAVKTARDWARKHRPHICDPTVVLPATAHAAFHKAAYYLGVRVVVTPVDPVSFRALPEHMRAATDENTILLVASAPSYAHGVVDPVQEIAGLAQARGILCHVDACVGGWLLPYFRRLGSVFPRFDFSVPGVTSLSMDLHKYAFTPKNASVVLYRDAALRLHQVYVCAEWAGYSVINMGVQSSRTGGPMAAAWAVMCALGDEGYLRIAQKMRDTTAALVKGIEQVQGLRVLGRPDMSLIAFASDSVNIFHIADEMRIRGWYVQPQFRRHGGAENIHLTVGPTQAPWVEAFLEDLKDAVAAASKLPVSELAVQMEEVFRQLDGEEVSDETLVQMMTMAGTTPEGGVPARMAEANQILNVMSPRLVERALGMLFNGAFRG
jgi:glutamate/tyrosine decarboxylase-like PLP-dependent enzyme